MDILGCSAPQQNADVLQLAANIGLAFESPSSLLAVLVAMSNLSDRAGGWETVSKALLAVFENISPSRLTSSLQDPTIGPLGTAFCKFCIDSPFVLETIHAATRDRSRQALAEMYAFIADKVSANGFTRLAAQWYQKALQLEPHHAVGNYFLGAHLGTIGDDAAALPWLKKALQLEPHNALYANAVSTCLDHLQLYDEAERYALLALQINADDIGAQRSLAVAYSKTDREGLAETAFRRILSVDALDANAVVNLIKLLRRHNDAATSKEINTLLCDFLSRFLQIKHGPTKFFTAIFTELTRTDTLTRCETQLRDNCTPGQEPGTGRHIVDRCLKRLGSLIGVLLTDSVFCVELLFGYAKAQLYYWNKLPSQEQTADIPESVRRLLCSFRSKFGSMLTEEQGDILDVFELRATFTNEEAFAQKMLEKEDRWIREGLESPDTDIARDLRNQLELELSLHAHVFQRDEEYLSANERDSILHRIHWLMELLKGQLLLNRIVRPGTHAFHRYANLLPVQVKSPVLGLSELQSALKKHGGPSATAINMCYLADPQLLMEPMIIALIVDPDGVPQLHVVKDVGGYRWKAFHDAATRVRWIDQLANNRKPGDDKIERYAEAQNDEAWIDTLHHEIAVENPCDDIRKHLADAFAALFRDVIPSRYLQDRTVWISPPPESFSVPIGLLRCDGTYVCDLVRSLIIVPIFSLGQYRSQDSHSGAQVIYGDDRWDECGRETSLVGHAESLEVFPESKGCAHPFQEGATPADVYEVLEALMKGREVVHQVIHHNPRDWVAPASEYKGPPASIGHWAASRLMIGSVELHTDLLVLESCEGRRPLDSDGLNVMGLWVSFLISRVNQIIASPFLVWPRRPGMKEFFDELYRESHSKSATQLAARLNSARAVLQELVENHSKSQLRLPTYWGAYELVSTLPVER